LERHPGCHRLELGHKYRSLALRARRAIAQRHPAPEAAAHQAGIFLHDLGRHVHPARPPEVRKVAVGASLANVNLDRQMIEDSEEPVSGQGVEALLVIMGTRQITFYGLHGRTKAHLPHQVFGREAREARQHPAAGVALLHHPAGVDRLDLCPQFAMRGRRRVRHHLISCA
jgi:hypothetical protein